jgi:hypothetical protein
MPSREFFQSPEQPPEIFSLPVDVHIDAESTAITEPVSAPTDTGNMSYYGPLVGAEIDDPLPEAPSTQENPPPTETPEQTEVPEIPPTAEARQQRFTEIMSCSPEFAAKHLPEFDKVVETTMQTAPGPHEKQSIQRVAGILRWYYFGKPGDQLPEGLVITEHDDMRQPTFDARKLFTERCAEEAYRQLGNDMRSILSAVTRHVAVRGEEARSEVHAIVNDNPGNALLRSFDAHDQPNTAETPLSQQERAIEEGKVRRAIMTRFGMNDTTPEGEIARGGAVDSALRRAYWRIDDETSQHPEPQKQDAFAKAKSYFAERLVMARNEFRQGIDLPPLDPKRAYDILVNYDATSLKGYDEDLRRELLGSILEVATSECDILTDPNRTLERESTLVTLDEGLRKIFSSDRPDSYDALLGSVEDHATGVLLYQSRPTPELYAYTISYARPRHQLLAPEGEYVPVETLAEATNSHEHISTCAQYHGSAEIEKSRQAYVGAVHRGSVPDQRIIRTKEVDPTLPENTPGDLTLLLTDEQFTYADPYIPGYTLVSRETDAYTFTRDSEDPYVAANVPIEDWAKRSLAAEYQRIGLSDLAAKLTQASSLTVEQLRSYVESESDYYIPDRTGVDANGNRIEVDDTRLSGFKGVVRNGKLLAQCSGAASFLKLSLERAFGEGNAHVVNGLSINRSTRVIDKAGHQQTSFIHDGRMYILDATPGGSTFPQQGQAPRVQEHLARQVPQETGELQMQPLVEPAKPKEEQLRATRVNFEQQLSVALGAPDQQALYERVAKLPEATDPVRRTMTLAMQATTGSARKADAETLHTFLKNYSEKGAAELKTMGLPAYDSGMLTMLAGTVQRIAENL